MIHVLSRSSRRVALALSALVLFAAACSSSDSDAGDDEPGDEPSEETTADAALPSGYQGHSSDIYAEDANWLCKPGLDDDVCGRDLDATAVTADGSTEVQAHEAAEDPPVDCFYVYPTTSYDEGPNSDLVPGEPEEIFTTYNQAARLNATCRVFAPVYRQLTLSAIGGGGAPAEDDVDPIGAAYDDVVDAFRQYVVHDSDGRGFVLIGHSQGSSHLTRLIADEIDDEPLLRDRLVSAYLLGSSVAVPAGDVVGGDFQQVPLCEAEDQTGCVVSYASFRSDAPPPDGSLFGRAHGGEGMQAACVNPVALGGGTGTLHPYFLVEQPEGTLLGGTTAAQAFADPARMSEITTPWITFPDFIDAECVVEDDVSYLALTVKGDPDDPRADDISGDLSPEWGMHLVDVNVAMGDIVHLVRQQAGAYVTG